MAPVLHSTRIVYCPSCGYEDQVSDPHVEPGQMVTHHHNCRHLGGNLVPLANKGTLAVHIVREREDYINGEHVLYDGFGRPIMAVNLLREDGMEANVFVPCAWVKREEQESVADEYGLEHRTVYDAWMARHA